jgi:hypothetical protein
MSSQQPAQTESRPRCIAAGKDEVAKAARQIKVRASSGAGQLRMVQEDHRSNTASPMLGPEQPPVCEELAVDFVVVRTASIERVVIGCLGPWRP